MDYAVSVSVQVSLPDTLWPATDRLWLVLTTADGRRWENTFAALDQPRGMSISRHFEPPSSLPRITLAFVAASPTNSHVESEFRANIALFDLPVGQQRYSAYAVLDDLRSNEISFELVVDAP
jgi:hypothetical protein